WRDPEPPRSPAEPDPLRPLPDPPPSALGPEPERDPELEPDPSRPRPGVPPDPDPPCRPERVPNKRPGPPWEPSFVLTVAGPCSRRRTELVRTAASPGATDRAAAGAAPCVAARERATCARPSRTTGAER